MLIHERIRLINHHGKQVLLVDLSNCAAVEVEKIVRAVPEFVTTRPRGSVLILSDFTGASFDEEAVRAMKESAVFDKPYIKKSAWVGAESFSEAFRDNLKSFSRREFPTFNNSPGSFGLASRRLNDYSPPSAAVCQVERLVLQNVSGCLTPFQDSSCFHQLQTCLRMNPFVPQRTSHCVSA